MPDPFGSRQEFTRPPAGITRALREAAKVLDIPLLDHVIVGSPSTAYPEGWFSFKAAGYV